MVNATSALNLATSRIGNIYNLSRSAMADTMIKLSSGKNYLKPKDGVTEYFKIERLNRDIRGYENVRRNLEKGVAMVGAAEGVGMQLVDDIQTLKKLTSQYWEEPAGSDNRTRIENEFNAVVAGMQNVIDAGVFEGRTLMAAGTLTSIILNPNDISQTLDVDFAAGDVVDTTSLAIDAGADYATTIADIDVELNKAFSYLSKTSGYISSFSSQISIANITIESNREYESVLNDIDDAARMKDLITQEIRQQAAISMLSQVGMMRMGVLKLFA